MEAHTLCIDIGNSTVKGAFFSEGGELLKLQRFSTPYEVIQLAGKPITYIDTRLDEEWRKVLLELGAEELHVGRGIPFPTDYSQQLGPDRAAQLVAAWVARRFPAVVLSVGTACTIDYLDREGHHRGGSITAGIRLRLGALAEKTGRLPALLPRSEVSLLGLNTEEAIQAGVVGGFQAEIAGQITRLRQRLGDFTLWVTGGEIEFIRMALPADAIFAPELTLRGVWLWQRFLHSSGDSSRIIP